ncbi:MAG TPA: OmpH family outer membrane protein [Chthoniobacterales bacterium]|nr:OmpH family outer membrane protein [Chthoniobacterales bacterium]
MIAHAVQAELSVGTVDMNRILKEYRKTKEAEAKLNDAKDAAKKEFDERADAYKKELEEINKLNAQLDAPALSAEAKTQKAKQRDEKIAAVKNMEREINEFRQTREQQLQQQVQRLQENLIKEITAVVLEQAKTKNFDLVFDTSGASLNRFSPILFSRERADFTTDVITALNKAPVAAATATPKPAAASKP